MIDHKDENQVEEHLQTISTAPRVTLEKVEALMDEVQYWVHVPAGTTTTIASAFLRGFHLADGHSYCINAENFNADFGKESALTKAHSNAKDAIWKLLGSAMFIHNNKDLFNE